jgi:hypothetical protein
VSEEKVHKVVEYYGEIPIQGVHHTNAWIIIARSLLKAQPSIRSVP